MPQAVSTSWTLHLKHLETIRSFVHRVCSSKPLSIKSSTPSPPKDSNISLSVATCLVSVLPGFRFPSILPMSTCFVRKSEALGCTCALQQRASSYLNLIVWQLATWLKKRTKAWGYPLLTQNHLEPSFAHTPSSLHNTSRTVPRLHLNWSLGRLVVSCCLSRRQ